MDYVLAKQEYSIQSYTIFCKVTNSLVISTEMARENTFEKRMLIRSCKSILLASVLGVKS